MNNSTTEKLYMNPLRGEFGYITEYEDGEKWWHSKDGTESHRVGEGEIIIPCDEIARMFAMIQSGLANNRTAIEQNTDNEETAPEQCVDNDPTEFGQYPDNEETDPEPYISGPRTPSQRKRDTQNARDGKRPPKTAKQHVESNPDLVKLLRSSKFIERISDGKYKRFQDLPNTCPQYIVDYANKKGFVRPDGRPYTQDTATTVLSSLKIVSRPSRFRLFYIVGMVIIASVVLTRIISHGGNSESDLTNVNNNTEQSVNKNYQNFVKINISNEDVVKICKKAGFQLTDTRIGEVLKKEYADEAEVLAECRRQYNLMVDIMAKQKANGNK